jgi:hypothetical protein
VVIQRIVRDVAELHRDRVFSDEVLADHCAAWVFQPKVLNWVAHAFYGGSTKPGSKSLIFDQLRAIAAELKDVEGVFVESRRV